MADLGPKARLSVDDWVQAGFDVIADLGLAGLTIDKLCKRVGATKGSFYWHFADMDAYRAALVGAWASLRDGRRVHFQELAGQGPRERLAAMISALMAPGQSMLERAMREWARSEPAVAAAVREADHRVFTAVREAFVDAGFEGEEAEIRAGGTFAAGIGFLHLSGPQPNWLADGRCERFLDVMLRA